MAEHLNLYQPENKQIPDSNCPEGENGRFIRSFSEPNMLKDYTTTVTILESITDYIFILNSIGNVEYANKSAQDILEKDLVDILGKNIDKFLIDNPEFPFETKPFQRDNSKLLEKFQGQILGDTEAGMLVKDDIIPVLLNFNTIVDPTGESNYYIVMAKDISQHKLLENELRQRQIRAIARDRIQSLGELSIGLVHEVTQPLTALKLKLELTQMSIDKDLKSSDALLQRFTEMQSLIDKMIGTIQSIRSFAQQTDDEVMTPVNIHEIIGLTLNLFAYELRKRNIMVDVNKKEGIPLFYANPLLIQQVLINLLMNSRDAFELQKAEAKKINIKIDAIADKWIEVVFRDNAGGIEKQNVHKIFNPFFTTKDSLTNTGMGLSVSKDIINALGGDIKVKSQLGKGSEFRLRIPISTASEQHQLFNLIEMMHN